MTDISTAKEIIHKHQKELPVQTVNIANDLGLKVYKTTDWPGGLSGMIKKDSKVGGQSGYAIFVNANHPETRRRFTIAHEIAHFVYHRDLIGDQLTDDALYRSGLSSTIETQANQIAADILMPWGKINEMMEEEPKYSVSDLAKIFHVSLSSMSIRLGVPYEGTESKT